MELSDPRVVDVRIGASMLHVHLDDGRILSVPLAWFPRLWAATSEELGGWELAGEGRGIRWPALGEELSVESLLRGVRAPRA